MLAPTEIKKEFPIFQSPHNSGYELAYLDNAATSQKPLLVLEAIQRYYTTMNANVGRGIYDLAFQSSKAFQTSREKVADFLNAETAEIIFTKGATEAINLVAQAYLSPRLKRGMNVVVTQMEHHANFIPWQQLCHQNEAEFRVVPLTDSGDIDLAMCAQMIDEKTQFVACTHVSNTLGTINPIEKIIELAHLSNAQILIDGAQAILSEKVDVSVLNADFYCFSGHKIFGPTGIGVLYCKKDHLADMIPYQTGGGMILKVTNEETLFAAPPAKFEAGTPHMAGVAGLSAAIDFVNSIGQTQISKHLKKMNAFARSALKDLEGVWLLAGGDETSGIISFHMGNIHPHDIATILDQKGIAVRAGHHCTEPLMQFLNLPGTVRVSFSVYNHEDEVNRLVDALYTVKKIFQ
jgi:cysteine desulfurase/selenocysteine lyase